MKLRRQLIKVTITAIAIILYYCSSYRTYRQKWWVLGIISLTFLCKMRSWKEQNPSPTLLTRSCLLKFIKIKPLAADASKLSFQVHSSSICQSVHFVFQVSIVADCFCPTSFTDLISEHPCYWAMLALWTPSMLETQTYQVVPFICHPNVFVFASYILLASGPNTSAYGRTIHILTLHRYKYVWLHLKGFCLDQDARWFRHIKWNSDLSSVCI